MSFKVRQHGQQQLYFQYKVFWILYKMVGAPSFLHIQPTLKYPPKNSSSTSVNFYISIAPLLFHKIILAIPLITLSASISHQFFTSLFLCTTIPAIYIKNIFPTSTILPIQVKSRLSQGIRELGSLVRTDTVLISSFFFKVCTVITGLTISLRKLVFCRFGRSSNPPSLIPSTYCHYFHTLLIPHKNLHSAGNKLLNLNFILSLAFSYSNHAPLQPYV